VLYRAWADGEPPRPAGRCLPDALSSQAALPAMPAYWMASPGQATSECSNSGPVRESTHTFSPFSVHRSMVGRRRSLVRSAHGKAILLPPRPLCDERCWTSPHHSSRKTQVWRRTVVSSTTFSHRRKRTVTPRRLVDLRRASARSRLPFRRRDRGFGHCWRTSRQRYRTTRSNMHTMKGKAMGRGLDQFRSEGAGASDRPGCVRGRSPTGCGESSSRAIHGQLQMLQIGQFMWIKAVARLPITIAHGI
jgi:hypothetical protein